MTQDHTETDSEGKAPERVPSDDRPPRLAELVADIDRARAAADAAAENIEYHKSELTAAVHRYAIAEHAHGQAIARYHAERIQADS